MITSVAALAPALAALGPILGVIAIGWLQWSRLGLGADRADSKRRDESIDRLQSLGSAVAAVWEAMKPLQPMLAEVGGGLLRVLGVLVVSGLIANLKILESVATAIGFVLRNRRTGRCVRD